jgi:excisionase family DNA binding protein
MNVSQWSDLPLVLTSDQAAAVLQLKRRTIANMLDRGDLRGVKIGKEWRVGRAELIRFVEGNGGSKARAAHQTEAEAGARPVLMNQEGVMVVRAEPLNDLADFVRREHDQRVADLIQQAGL